ncbi:hypothetical protein MPSEU_001090700 [Mayamaea pseudoterrestris]|nr:hypothetical protein MPSEU_001090700 [Mayamaea pseudoterrestris]
MTLPITSTAATRLLHSRRRSSLASVVLVTTLVSVTLSLRSSHALQPNSFQTSTSKQVSLINNPQVGSSSQQDFSFAPLPTPLASPPTPLLQQQNLAAATSNSLETPPSEYDLSVGRALDALRKDYPDILCRPPDYSIYADNIEVIDPSGVTLHGLVTYRNSFRLLQALIKVVYCPSRSGLTFRLCYDKARRNIRVHWNAHVLPRFSFNKARQQLYVDGISVYELDQETGEIVQHRIEHILINNEPVLPKEGVFAALEQQHTMSVPSFSQQVPAIAGGSTNGKMQRQNSGNMVTEFRPWDQRRTVPSSSLFMMVQGQGGDASSSSAALSNSSPVTDFPDLDWKALEAKNKSRKKFGLQPVTPEEFMKLQTEVADLAQEQLERQQQLLQQQAQAKLSEPKPNFLQQLFGQALKDTCETNYDCERPMVCCDFGITKKCCSSGMRVVDGPPQYATVPVPQGIDDEYGYPPGRGPAGDGAGNERLW